MTPAEALDAAARCMSQGGAVMWPLVAVAVVLWYAVGYRAVLVRRGTRLDVASAVARGRGGRPLGPGLLAAAVGAALAAAHTAAGVGRGAAPVAARASGAKRRVEVALAPCFDRLDRGAVLARTLVAVAPLLGLLGTVTGMIEMFDSMGSGTFYAQEGGIARGIAEALLTTELGLCVAIPGYFATRVLDRGAARLRTELGQVAELACAGAAAARSPVPGTVVRGGAQT